MSKFDKAYNLIMEDTEAINNTDEIKPVKRKTSMNRFLSVNFPSIKVTHIPELSHYNHQVYELISRIDGSETKIYIVEECDDDNLMIYSLLTERPESVSKNYDHVLFQWETSWDDRIRFDE